jgi:hypothetical protein
MRFSYLSLFEPGEPKPQLGCIEEETDTHISRDNNITVRLPQTSNRGNVLGQPSVVYRTVQIDNLPSDAPMDILMPLLDTGRILSVAVDYGPTTEMTLTFLHEAAARTLVERRKEDPIIFGTQVAQVYITEPPSGALTDGQALLLKAGVTRCLHFCNMLENLTRIEFDKIVARITKAPNEEVVLYSKKDFQNGEVRMSFTSLEKAVAAKALFDSAIAHQGVGANWKWRGCVVAYVPDEGMEATGKYLARLEDENFLESSCV